MRCDDIEKIYDKKGIEYERKIQLNQIKKVYPLFDEYKPHYILWIISDMYYNYYNVDIFGEVNIIKNNGDIIPVNICIKKPYPNKYYSQISMKKGNKKCFGIPLIFNSLEEISQINEITINWDIYDLVNLNISSVISKYKVSFEKDKISQQENNVYTLYSCFKPYNPVYSLLDIDLKNKAKQYDYFLATSISHIRNTDGSLDKSNKHIYEVYSEFKSDATKYKKVINLLDELHYNQNSIYKAILNCPNKYEVEWNKYYLEKNITLNRKPLANILLGTIMTV